MIALPLILMITEALKLVNNLIEGVPVAERQKQAQIWFLWWWPRVRIGLKLAGVKEEELKGVEEMGKGGVKPT